MHGAYTKYLRGYMYHGSSDKIKSFHGPLFLAEQSLATSYGFDGYLYKCKVNAKNPLVLIENRDRMRRTGDNNPNGFLLAGTDTLLRDFVRDELLLGASTSVIDQFDSMYAKRGVSVPARLFCTEDYSSGWSIVAKNLVRLGYDAMLFEDESFDVQFRGVACFVPDSALVSIVDSCEVSEYGETPEGFDA